MSSEHHARVKELFLAACELPPEERLEFLQRECGSSEALLDEVEELLGYHQAETTGESPKPTARLDDLESIVDFKVLQRIGEGGMGEVYEAEQTNPIRRRVALKVIKWGMDTKQVLARFESERQALALMNHPNIAGVYDAGMTVSGRPYFSMEYVKGVSLTDYCDMHRLSTAHRLGIFIQVCMGVQHAHQRGVIHRDIKPSNILVTIQDDEAVPKIIDFGVAKATSQRLTERTVFTELGQWIGTPEYMSPEQAEMTGLDIDTRTDVYSLGVVLYELLVGAQPFDSTTLRSAGFDEMRRRIREEEPPRPSTRLTHGDRDSDLAAERRRTSASNLARELKGDLDWIVMKALEKDRTRRYATPMELAADVRRHMDNEPVEASPPSTHYRLGKFVRRNRVAVATASLVIAALVLGTIGTAVGMVKAKREAHAAQQVVQLMSGILGGLNPTGAYGHTESIDEILDRGLVQIDETLEGQPLVAARLKDLIGRVYMGLGEFFKARPVLEDAYAIRLAELGDANPSVGDSLDILGVARMLTGDYEDALAVLEEAVVVYEGSVGLDHGAVGYTLTNICYVQWRLGNYDKAMDYCDQAVANLERNYGVDGLAVATPLSNQAIVLRELGEQRQALAVAQRALSIREHHLGPDHTAVGWALHDLALCQEFIGDFDTARALQKRAMAIQIEALGPDSNAVSMSLTRLAVARKADGELEEARAMFQRAMEIRENALGVDHPDLVWLLLPYAHLLRDLGEEPAARRMLERNLAIAEKWYGSEHMETAGALAGLAYHEYAVGRVGVARDLMERSLETQVRVVGAKARRLGITYYNLACINAIEGNSSDALANLQLALDTGWSWRGVESDSDLDSLRGDPEFKALAAENRRRIDAGV
jgi:non-specific serine/threonine protein kinase/serine/threonine-protein kinase